MRRAANSGFTLIELMVVVIIIAALAGIVLPYVIPAGDTARRKAAIASMANIKVSLNLYRLNNGKYPASLEVLTNPDPKYNNEPYLEEPALDPWNKPFVYRIPGQGGRKYEIISGGPDGQEGGDDDVHHWDKE